MSRQSNQVSVFSQISLATVVLLGLLFALSSCATINTLQSVDPTKEPHFTPYIMLPEHLDCSAITSTHRGRTWENLTVGVSTHEDVYDFYGQYFERKVYETHRFANYRQGGLIFTTCFTEGKLSAIKVIEGSTPNIPEKLSEIVEVMGEPEHVTWGQSYYHRSLVWVNEGVLIDYTIDPTRPEEYRRSGVIFFSPIKEKNYRNSWVYHSLPKEGESYEDLTKRFEGLTLDDLLTRLPPEKEVANPWGFGKKW